MFLVWGKPFQRLKKEKKIKEEMFVNKHCKIPLGQNKVTNSILVYNVCTKDAYIKDFKTQL